MLKSRKHFEKSKSSEKGSCLPHVAHYVAVTFCLVHIVMHVPLPFSCHGITKAVFVLI
jgi:hypothetical protein